MKIEKAQGLRAQLENYLLSAPRETLLSFDQLDRDIKPILADPEAGVGQLCDRFAQFDWWTLVGILKQRPDLSYDRIEQVATNLERVFSDTITHQMSKSFKSNR